MSRGTTPRMRKVNELIREIVAEQVNELKDPRIGFVTITGVDTAPNLRQAIVFYSVMGSEEEASATGEALTHAHSRIQRAINAQTHLKYTPVLEFRRDPAIEHGLRIDQILRDLEQDHGDDEGDNGD